jgi:hypothetical protein
MDHRAHKSPSLDPILKLNPVNILTSHFSRVHFHVTFTLLPCRPNIAIEWLTILLRIWRSRVQIYYRISRSILRVSWFSSVTPDNCRDRTLKLGHDHFLPNPLQFIIHLSPYNSTLYSLHYWKSSLNKIYHPILYFNDNNTPLYLKTNFPVRFCDLNFVFFSHFSPLPNKLYTWNLTF